MLMVVICGSSGGNKKPQFAVGILTREKKDDYMSVMNCYIELLKECEIFMPKYFVTD